MWDAFLENCQDQFFSIQRNTNTTGFCQTHSIALPLNSLAGLRSCVCVRTDRQTCFWCSHTTHTHTHTLRFQSLLRNFISPIGRAEFSRESGFHLHYYVTGSLEQIPPPPPGVVAIVTGTLFTRRNTCSFCGKDVSFCVCWYMYVEVSSLFSLMYWSNGWVGKFVTAVATFCRKPSNVLRARPLRLLTGK